MERHIEVRGAAHLELIDGVSLLAPSAQVFEAMLDGWRSQQLSRNLAFSSIDAGARTVRRFQEHVDVWPWEWTPAQLESWCAELRERRVRARTTVRSYQLAVRSFLTYVIDPLYGWDRECLDRFGTHAVQIAGRENTAMHVTDYEGDPARRALTRSELQALFDAADDTVAGIRSRGRKGWIPAFRDATMLKVAYGWGLRRHELVMLEAPDWGLNPHAGEFGGFGVCYVRWGKASHGSAPRRRSVLTVMGWAAEVISEWVTDIWPHAAADGEIGLWPSERRPRVSDDRVTAAFSKAASDAGLPATLTLHCLRHSYATHLLEDGFDTLFVQQQLGHQHVSTTSIYTSVSSDYKTRILRHALDRVAAEARNQGRPMKRNVGYRWRLREVMGANGLWKTSELGPLLAERGVELSGAQIYRLVARTPERLSLRTLAALCDIFACEPGDLIETFVGPAAKTKAQRPGAVVDLATVGRPRRARIRPRA